ncbi:MAG: hypothetical protein AB2693_19495 [Candidatus Thiodiazotropha sp.]
MKEDKDVFCHPPSSTVFLNESCLMPWKTAKVSIGGRNMVVLRFAADTDALAEKKQELEALTV